MRLLIEHDGKMYVVHPELETMDLTEHGDRGYVINCTREIVDLLHARDAIANDRPPEVFTNED